MKAFVAYRYPGEESLYLSENSNGKTSFLFQGFTKKDKRIIVGDLVPYDRQLFDHKRVALDSKPHVSKIEEYTQQFNTIQSAFQTTTLKKAVLSRVIAHPIPDINLHLLFMALCKVHPTAMVYVTWSAEYGLWAGASPERLLKFEEGQAHTVALAGTKLTNETRSWTSKEKEEHKIVEQFYFDLSQRNEEFKIIEKSKPYTIPAGIVSHLKSDFIFALDAKKRTSILDQIHPTPAVAGYPQEEAIELILQTEHHKRELYTGYFGLSTNLNPEYYVNLRCMKLGINTAYIYVGGGLNRQSDLKAEWQETINKSQTMIQALSNVPVV